jgi:hypothetical protein
MTPAGMVNGDLRDQIVRLEAEIEQLAEIAERCRKAVLFSKIAIGVGGIGVLAYFIGPFTFDSTVIIGAIAAIVGGVVVFGSNSSTSKQTMAAMKEAESQRAKLIDILDFGHQRTSSARRS